MSADAYNHRDGLESALASIDAQNPVLNAITAMDREGARQAAAAAQRRTKPRRQFEGLLLGVKDNIAVKGGFPPLQLQPIDFDTMYKNAQAQQAGDQKLN